jgi:cytochrome P450
MTTLDPAAGRTASVPPVRWDDHLGVFVVSGFDEASAVLRGSGWSSDPANNPMAPPELTQVPSNLMLFRDPPDHTRLRRLVSPAFSARAIEGLHERVATIVDSCLDGFEADGPGQEVDLLADYGYLIPIAVIAELLDVGVEGAQIFLDQTPQLVRLLEVDAGPEDFAAAAGAGFAVTMFLTPILVERRASGGHAGDDFISALLATELTVDEVLATCILLLAAGHETTANLIANGSLAVLRHPGQQAHLQADPARAVEELLRLEGPVKLIARTATEDHDLAGLTIPEGRQVLVRLDRANRDPRRWPDADRMDLSRRGPAHLGFGIGIHFCLGAALARLEGAQALARLFARFPRLSLAHEDVPWRASSTFHAVEALAVRLD